MKGTMENGQCQKHRQDGKARQVYFKFKTSTQTHLNFETLAFHARATRSPRYLIHCNHLKVILAKFDYFWTVGLTLL